MGSANPLVPSVESNPAWHIRELSSGMQRKIESLAAENKKLSFELELRCAELRRARRGVSDEGTQHRSDAWQAVWAVLMEHNPHMCHRPLTGQECAIGEIRELQYKAREYDRMRAKMWGSRV